MIGEHYRLEAFGDIFHASYEVYRDNEFVKT